MDSQEFENGFTQLKLVLPNEVEDYIQEKNWVKLDSLLSDLLRPGQLLFNELSKFVEINHTEHIIAIRNADDDEDGIWHDDGSRELAFTVSLTKNAEEIEGGILQLRKKGLLESQNISTPEFGTLTIMNTGREGYEHRVLKVTNGIRIICAGWIN